MLNTGFRLENSTLLGRSYLWRGSYVGWRRAIKGTGWAYDDEVARAIVERNANLSLIREIFIRLGDVRLKVFEE